MARKGNIAEQYLETGVDDRIDTILNNYRDFSSKQSFLLSSRQHRCQSPDYNDCAADNDKDDF